MAVSNTAATSFAASADVPMKGHETLDRRGSYTVSDSCLNGQAQGQLPEIVHDSKQTPDSEELTHAPTPVAFVTRDGMRIAVDLKAGRVAGADVLLHPDQAISERMMRQQDPPGTAGKRSQSATADAQWQAAIQTQQPQVGTRTVVKRREPSLIWRPSLQLLAGLSLHQLDMRA